MFFHQYLDIHGISVFRLLYNWNVQVTANEEARSVNSHQHLSSLSSLSLSSANSAASRLGEATTRENSIANHIFDAASQAAMTASRDCILQIIAHNPDVIIVRTV